MDGSLSSIRLQFLLSMEENLFSPEKLLAEINQFYSNGENSENTHVTFFFEVQFPLSSPPGMTSNFVKPLLEEFNNALVGASGGGGELPPHIGSWIDDKDRTLVKEPMRTMKFDVKISKLIGFAKELHRVILNIQQLLKQKVVYVKMDQEVRHIDALKQSDEYFPDHDEFTSPEESIPSPSEIEGDVLFENMVIGEGSSMEIRIGKLSIRDGSVGTVIANLMQISGGIS